MATVPINFVDYGKVWCPMSGLYYSPPSWLRTRFGSGRGCLKLVLPARLRTSFLVLTSMCWGRRSGRPIMDEKRVVIFPSIIRLHNQFFQNFIPYCSISIVIALTIISLLVKFFFYLESICLTETFFPFHFLMFFGRVKNTFKQKHFYLLSIGE